MEKNILQLQKNFYSQDYLIALLKLKTSGYEYISKVKIEDASEKGDFLDNDSGEKV